MKRNQIIIVILAFVFLAILYAVQKSRQREIVKGLGYENVMGNALATADIYGFKYSRSGETEPAVHVVRENEEWVVESKFDAPADEDKVGNFIALLSDLAGELRSSSEAVLADYGLDEESAVHLHLLDADGQTQKHLLLGKQGPGGNETFVRLKGSNDVYLVREDIRRYLGIPLDDTGQPLKSTQWCELTLLALLEPELSRIEFDAPYRRLVVEYREKTEPAGESATEEATEEAGAGKETAQPAPEGEWVLMEPDLDGQPKESGIRRLTHAFARVSASDVVGRDNLEDYGLEPPVATYSLRTREGQTHNLLFGAPVPDSKGAYYARMNDENLVYRIERWVLNSIILKMTDITDIYAPTFPKEEVTALIMEGDERQYELEKENGVWHLRRPPLDFEVKGEQLNRAVATLAALNPQDMATLQAPDLIKLDEPSAIVKLVLEDGTSHTFTFGADVPLTAGDRFVRLDDREDIWIIGNGKWNTVEPAAEKLFDLTVLDFRVEDASSLMIDGGSGKIQLAYGKAETEDQPADTQWIIEGGGKSVNQEAVDSLLSLLAGLAADDVFATAESTGLTAPVWRAAIELTDGRTLELAIGEERDDSGYYATATDHKSIFLIDAETVAQLRELTQNTVE